MGYIPKIKWEDNATNTERLRAIYNFLNNLLFEMYGGRVPSNKEELQENINATKNELNVPLSIAFVKMAEQGEIDEVTASEHANMFLAWQENMQCKAGMFLQHEGRLYRVLQDHTSQADWLPDLTAALYKAIGFNEEGIPYWSQPISQQDSYMKDAEVVNPDDGSVWVSDLDYNVWKPGVYGWHLKK